jgi:hypothetical protein
MHGMGRLVWVLIAFVAAPASAQPRFVESIESRDNSMRLEAATTFNATVPPSNVLILAVTANRASPSDLTLSADVPVTVTPFVTSRATNFYSNNWVQLLSVQAADAGIRSMRCGVDGGQPDGGLSEIVCIWLNYAGLENVTLRSTLTYASEVSQADAAIVDAGTLDVERGDFVLAYAIVSNVGLPLVPSPWTIRSTFLGDLIVEAVATQSGPFNFSYLGRRTISNDFWTTSVAVALTPSRLAQDGGGDAGLSTQDAGTTTSDGGISPLDGGLSAHDGGPDSGDGANVAQDSGASAPDAGSNDAGALVPTFDAGAVPADAGAGALASRYDIGCASSDSSVREWGGLLLVLAAWARRRKDPSVRP